MGFENLESQLQQARQMCETNADRMKNACQSVKGTKKRIKLNHDDCAPTCNCKNKSKNGLES